jgi:hypothetical protein
MDTMRLVVIGPDADPIFPLEALSYTVWADGRLEVALAEGGVRQFEADEWADVVRC